MKLESDHNIREMHNKVKSLTNKKKGAKSASGCIMDKDGRMLFTEAEIKERWREYASELYDDPTRPEAVEIEVDGGTQISMDEVKKVIKKERLPE